ncbi:hypothetical protein CYMTET_26472, partial [Cymbomonas tetramitiformis]
VRASLLAATVSLFHYDAANLTSAAQYFREELRVSGELLTGALAAVKHMPGALGGLPGLMGMNPLLACSVVAVSNFSALPRDPRQMGALGVAIRWKPLLSLGNVVDILHGKARSVAFGWPGAPVYPPPPPPRPRGRGFEKLAKVTQQQLGEGEGNDLRLADAVAAIAAGRMLREQSLMLLVGRLMQHAHCPLPPESISGKKPASSEENTAEEEDKKEAAVEVEEVDRKEEVEKVVVEEVEEGFEEVRLQQGVELMLRLGRRDVHAASELVIELMDLRRPAWIAQEALAEVTPAEDMDDFEMPWDSNHTARTGNPSKKRPSQWSARAKVQPTSQPKAFAAPCIDEELTEVEDVTSRVLLVVEYTLRNAPEFHAATAITPKASPQMFHNCQCFFIDVATRFGARATARLHPEAAAALPAVQLFCRMIMLSAAIALPDSYELLVPAMAGRRLSEWLAGNGKEVGDEILLDSDWKRAAAEEPLPPYDALVVGTMALACGDWATLAGSGAKLLRELHLLPQGASNDKGADLGGAGQEGDVVPQETMRALQVLWLLVRGDCSIGAEVAAGGLSPRVPLSQLLGQVLPNEQQCANMLALHRLATLDRNTLPGAQQVVLVSKLLETPSLRLSLFLETRSRQETDKVLRTLRMLLLLAAGRQDVMSAADLQDLGELLGAPAGLPARNFAACVRLASKAPLMKTSELEGLANVGLDPELILPFVRSMQGQPRALVELGTILAKHNFEEGKKNVFLDRIRQEAQDTLKETLGLLGIVGTVLRRVMDMLLRLLGHLHVFAVKKTQNVTQTIQNRAKHVSRMFTGEDLIGEDEDEQSLSLRLQCLIAAAQGDVIRTLDLVRELQQQRPYQLVEVWRVLQGYKSLVDGYGPGARMCVPSFLATPDSTLLHTALLLKRQDYASMASHLPQIAAALDPTGGLDNPVNLAHTGRLLRVACGHTLACMQFAVLVSGSTDMDLAFFLAALLDPLATPVVSEGSEDRRMGFPSWLRYKQGFHQVMAWYQIPTAVQQKLGNRELVLMYSLMRKIARHSRGVELAAIQHRLLQWMFPAPHQRTTVKELSSLTYFGSSTVGTVVEQLNKAPAIQSWTSEDLGGSGSDEKTAQLAPFYRQISSGMTPAAADSRQSAYPMAAENTEKKAQTDLNQIMITAMITAYKEPERANLEDLVSLGLKHLVAPAADAKCTQDLPPQMRQVFEALLQASPAQLEQSVMDSLLPWVMEHNEQLHAKVKICLKFILCMKGEDNTPLEDKDWRELAGVLIDMAQINITQSDMVCFLKIIVALGRREIPEVLRAMNSLSHVMPNQVHLLMELLQSLGSLAMQQQASEAPPATGGTGRSEDESLGASDMAKALTFETLFQQLDPDGDGEIPTSGLNNLLIGLKLNLTEERRFQLLALADGGTGVIKLEQMDEAMKILAKELAEDCMRTLGISWDMCIALLVSCIAYLTLVMVFLFIGIKAFSTSGTFSSIVESIFAAGAGLGASANGAMRDLKADKVDVKVKRLR